MILEKVDFDSFDSEYSNHNCLSYKKSRIAKDYFPEGENYLHIGICTGELISLQVGKHKKISGINYDKTPCTQCKRKFDQYVDSNLIKVGITDIQKNFNEQFNYIICFDFLKNTEEREVASMLKIITNILNKNGTVFFSGPGIIEKIRFYFGRSATHIYSHSSYGWNKKIEATGFAVFGVEIAEFPKKNGESIWKMPHHCCTKAKYWWTL